tara:strand:- start:488 stop:832 length:345 start_codon:yes stop_codon:yes gene_type:complete
MEKKISKEEFDFRVKCVELCLEDIKNNDEPLRSLFDINIATDLDDKECLDWYEGGWGERQIKIMEKENIKFTPTELSCLLDMVEQDIEDNDECIRELHKETLKDIYNKLVILNK